MAKRIVVYDNGRTIVKPKEVPLRSLLEARLRVAGPQTGKMYEWSNVGVVVLVREDDAVELLKMTRGGCCGAPPTPYFVLES